MPPEPPPTLNWEDNPVDVLQAIAMQEGVELDQERVAAWRSYCEEPVPVPFKPTRLPWSPTHKHIDGGLYRFERQGKMKADHVWSPSVSYTDAKGEYFTTSLERWNSRFVEIGDDDGY